MTETVLVGAFAHETNTFVPEPVGRVAFQDREEYLGDAVEANLRGTETAVGGVIDAAEELDVELVHTVAAFATPGGVVTREAYEFYAGLIVDGVREHLDALDGVILPLHGAMVAEHLDDGEGPLAAAVRDLVGPDVPIVVTLDLHANVSDELVAEADAIVAYETYPHLDKAETGRNGLALLALAMRGEVEPVMHVERPPTLVLQPKAYTPSGPMAEVMAQARREERRPGVLKVNVLPGFYHADVPEMGVSTPVVTDGDPDLAREVSRTMAARIWARRDEFVEEYPKPREAVEHAKAVAEGLGPDDGPVVMAEFGSNPGGGGASNGTTVLRELLEQGVRNAGWAIMHDPEAVADCIAAGVGERVTMDIGGWSDDLHGAPIEDLDGYVKAVTDGRYVNTGSSHSGYGVQNAIGRTVRLQCGPEDSVTVVLAEKRSSAFDAEIWRHVGQPPERLDVICIPSLIAFLGDYEPLSSEVVLVDTPGLSAVDPARFEYEEIPRPVYPLDAMPDDAYPDWT